MKEHANLREVLSFLKDLKPQREGTVKICPDCEEKIAGMWCTGQCDDCGGSGVTDDGDLCTNCRGFGMPVCCRCEGSGIDPFTDTKELDEDSVNTEAFEEEYSGPKKYSKKTSDGRTVRYGAKGYRIAPGTSKGDSYCARSNGQMKKHPTAANDPNSPLRLSRKKWRCSGDKSRKD